MTDQAEPLRWGAERRLEFIEFQAFWEGAVNRSDIRDRFGVSVPQASNDLSLYQKMAPENLVYDASAKRYVPTLSFQPRFLKPNPDRYLAQLRGIADEIIELEETWITNPPPSDAMPIPQRKLNAEVLRGLVMAIRRQQSAEILYQSMNRHHPDPLKRWVTPHAFGFDGVQWHMRAYCHIDKGFKNFLLSRCYGVGDFGAAGAAAEEDILWQTRFTVVLAPNPGLSEAQRRAIALEYAMTDEQLALPVRKALIFYFDKRMRLDYQQYDDTPAHNPLIVINRAEYDAVLAEVTRPVGESNNARAI
jgi:predicted DNA-binding transcriptional regulator YafY